MVLDTVEDSFKILRLRLLRLPPAQLAVPEGRTGRPATVALELAVGITDDYGVNIDSFESLDFLVQAVDSTTSLPLRGVTLTIEGWPKPSQWTLQTVRGHFHTLRATLSFTNAPPPSLRILLSMKPVEGAVPALSAASERMRVLIGEEQQEPLEAWDGHRYMFMRALSGEVLVKRGSSSASSAKVQTIHRTIHIPQTDAKDNITPITVLERPGLNNSTGQRLWDCAVGLSCYLSLYPDLFPSSSNPEGFPPNKRARINSSSIPPLTILELGAGCALASLVASTLHPHATVISTDVEATIDTTLSENLKLNARHSTRIQPAVLGWGPLAPDRIDELLDSDPSRQLLIIGADILYNPESHSILLESLEALLRRGGGDRRGLIAYKARTEGDDGFFERARGNGLSVEKVWEWGDVAVWSFEVKE